MGARRRCQSVVILAKCNNPRLAQFDQGLLQAGNTYSAAVVDSPAGPRRITMKTTKLRKSKPEGEIGQLVLRAAEAKQRAEVARKRVRLAKAQYKGARKAFKKAKRAAKDARKLAKAAGKALKLEAKDGAKATRPPRPKKPQAVPPPPRKGKAAKPMISTTPFSKTTSTVTTPTPPPSAVSDIILPSVTPEEPLPESGLF